jgi:hypothetical protein
MRNVATAAAIANTNPKTVNSSAMDSPAILTNFIKMNNPVPNAIYNLLHQPVIVIDHNDQTIAEGHLHPTYKFGEEQSTVIVDDYQFEPTDVFSVLCVQNETPIIRIKSE